MVVPSRVAMREADRFAASRQVWIERALDRYRRQTQSVPVRRLITGERLPLFGEEVVLDVTVEPGRVRSYVKEDEGRLFIKASDAREVRKKIVGWYRMRSRDFFTAWSIEMANTLGVQAAQVRVRDMKTQWGSCNSKKRVLTYNWKLALAPAAVARYVVAHEAAHLRYANHSKKFWGVVALLMPDYAEHRLRLKRHGHELVL